MPITTHIEATHEQESRLDSLCTEHGNLEIELLATRPGFGTMFIEAEDGAEFSIARDGTITTRRST